MAVSINRYNLNLITLNTDPSNSLPPHFPYFIRDSYYDIQVSTALLKLRNFPYLIRGVRDTRVPIVLHKSRNAFTNHINTSLTRKELREQYFTSKTF